MRSLCIAVLMATLAGAAVRAPSKHAWGEYGRELTGPRAFGGAAAGAAYGTALNRPHEWGQGLGGFAKRFGSGFARHAVKTTIQVPLAAAFHENLHYQPSNLQGSWPRLKYAVKSTFIVPRTNRPGQKVAVSRLSGNLGAGLISRAWQPASTAGIGAGVVSGGVGLGADVGINVAHEFWPRKHPVAGRAIR
jgi:hypothetical protein